MHGTFILQPAPGGGLLLFFGDCLPAADAGLI